MTNRNLAARAEAFITAASAKHNGKYDYSRVTFEYINAHAKVRIGCDEHGTFTQTPNEHKQGAACPSCSYRRGASVRSRTSRFIDSARKVHGDAYDYDGITFIDQRTPIKITCRIHGRFEQRPINHLAGHHCPDCGHVNRTTTRRQAPSLPDWPTWWN